jgi:hypothetical protein
MSEKPVCLNNEHIGGRINIADAIGLKLFSASSACQNSPTPGWSWNR